MTSDNLCIGMTDEFRQASLVKGSQTLSTKDAADPFSPIFVPPSIAAIAIAGAGAASTMVAYPFIVASTVTPDGAGINRVVATEAYAEYRD